MTNEEYERSMVESKGYNYNDEFCNGNNCVCKYIGKTLFEDIGCKDQEGDKFMTTKNYK